MRSACGGGKTSKQVTRRGGSPNDVVHFVPSAIIPPRSDAQNYSKQKCKQTILHIPAYDTTQQNLPAHTPLPATPTYGTHNLAIPPYGAHKETYSNLSNITMENSIRKKREKKEGRVEMPERRGRARRRKAT